MGIAFRVIWAADFNNAIRYYVRRPSGWSHPFPARGDPLSAGWAADVKSDGIIEISGSKNPKTDTHNDISVNSFQFWCAGGRRVTLSRWAGQRT